MRNIKTLLTALIGVLALVACSEVDLVRARERVAQAGGLAVIDHGYVFPGFDNIEARLPFLAWLLRGICYRAEDSALLRRFGLSHLLVLRRDQNTDRRVGAGQTSDGARP